LAAGKVTGTDREFEAVVASFLHGPHRRLKLQQVDSRSMNVTVNGWSGAFGSLAAAALRASADSEILSRT
jgi:hypothetical protein